MLHFFRLPDIVSRFSFSRAFWYRLVQKDLAPAPVKAGCSSFWPSSDIDTFEASFKEGKYLNWSSVNSARRLQIK